MKIESSTRLRAMCDILERRLRVWGISTTDLQRAWHKTGLRYSDMEGALRDLVQQGAIRVRESTQGRRVHLAFGHDTLQVPGLDPAHVLIDRVRLLRMRLRMRTETPSTSLRRRRASDRI